MYGVILAEAFINIGGGFSIIFNHEDGSITPLDLAEVQKLRTHYDLSTVSFDRCRYGAQAPLPTTMLYRPAGTAYVATPASSSNTNLSSG